ncbi:MAG: PKD domain-containing protein, partial [Ferruginibacter sp.]
MKQQVHNTRHLFYRIWFFLFLFIANNSIAQPVAQFTASTTSACAPVLINFTDQSTGLPLSWEWDLGNGTHSYLQNPSVTYFNPGQYAVKLIVRNGSGTDSIVKLNYITIHHAPVVNFSTAAATGCSPFQVQFNDISSPGSGTLTTWRWDMGDGTISTLSNPAHTYTVAGNYHVTLIVRNSNGCSGSKYMPDYITVNYLDAGFTHNVQNTCNPTTLIFSNTSVGNGTLSYAWTFGDGTTSTAVNPTHTYANAGNYTIKLITRSNTGCVDSAMSSVTVAPKVSAAFTANATSNCKAPFTVSFTSTPMNGNAYFWDFGDTTFDQTPNPIHTYSDTGKFTVRLVVTNINGCVDSLTKTDFIKIKRPFIEYANIPDSGCAPFTKQFLASVNSVDNVVSYLWNFGDGTTSSLATPTHSYNATGAYDVSLIVRTSSGCTDTMRWERGIAAGVRPTANFSADAFNVCASQAVNFTDLSTGVINSWYWDFGDAGSSVIKNPSRSYQDTGFMNVRLIVRNNGCADTMIKPAYVFIKAPISRFQIVMDCAKPFERKFLNFSVGADTWTWDFGDGTFSTELNPTHVFPATGPFDIKLTSINNTTGCTYTKTAKVPIVNVIPDFTVSDTVICKGGSVTFTPTGVGNDDIRRFTWFYGDGTSKITFVKAPVTKVYKNSGYYTITLVTYDFNGCLDTITKTNFIRVNGPTAKYVANATGNCLGMPTGFTDQTTTDGRNAIQSWTWTFGDGNTEVFT